MAASKSAIEMSMPTRYPIFAGVFMKGKRMNIVAWKMIIITWKLPAITASIYM
jgi:hypothetical protein